MCRFCGTTYAGLHDVVAVCILHMHTCILHPIKTPACPHTHPAPSSPHTTHKMPWMSLSFLTLWLQMVGFADSQASFLVALFTLGCAAGSLLGGYLGMVGVHGWHTTMCAHMCMMYHVHVHEVPRVVHTYTPTCRHRTHHHMYTPHTPPGDRFSRVHPCGRIFVNQLSVLLGLPMCMVLLKGLPWPLLTTPPSAALHWVYASVLLPFGLVASWYGVCRWCV